jgi:predicted nucleotidyltransferase
MPTKGYIYLIRNLLNGKAYIGKTEKSVSLRFSQHKTQSKIGSAYALHAAMRKYGVHNFSKGRKRPAFSDEWKARISAGKNRQYAQMRKEAQFAHIN